MDSIWKVTLSFAVVVMITVVGITMTSVSTDVAAAGDYMEDLASVIRESNYNEAVIQQCREEATERGYELEVSVCRSKSRTWSSYAKLSLHYPCHFPAFGLEEEKVKEKII